MTPVLTEEDKKTIKKNIMSNFDGWYLIDIIELLVLIIIQIAQALLNKKDDSLEQ